MRSFSYKFMLLLLILFSGCSFGTNSRGATITISKKESIKTPQTSIFKKYYGLLIYVDDYTYLDKLKTPKNDVKEIAKLLKSRYGFNKIKIINNPKNSDELVAILDKLSQEIDSDDNLLIYYAGHGTYFKKGDMGYWLLKDAHKDSRVGWISLNQAINFTLNNMRAKHILVISDSCYSGAITRDANLELSQQNLTYQDIDRLKSRTALSSGGLEPVLDSDYENSQNSVFANGILSVLKQNRKARFTLEEKFPQIKRYVKLKSSQTPLYADIKKTGHQMGGDFIFIDKTVKQSATPSYPKTSIKAYRNNPKPSYITQCKNGNAKACYNTAIMYKRGDYGVIRSDIIALGYFDRACKLGYAKGCLGVGFAYMRGDSIPRDTIKAQKYFDKSCSLGIKKACIK